ncbi:MAG: hypothetical protein ACO23V_02160 [Chitinophagaceae bacterium]
MKKMFFAILAMQFSLLVFAQAENPDSTTMIYLTEFRYQSKTVAQKYYPESRTYWMKNVPEMLDRFSFSSDSRRAYTFSMFRGEKNYGQYIGSRSTINERFKVEHKEAYENTISNMIGATTRSSWRVLRDQSSTEPNWNANKYNYRKLNIYTIPHGQYAVFEALLKEIKEYEAKTNRTMNRVILRCVDGYSGNTYMTMLPDNDVNEFYQHRQARSQNRDAKLTELYDKLYSMITIVRTDDLYRFTF